MAKITARIAHQSGIPLGGIGTGTVEIRPDGYFHEWQIFNLGRWAPQQPECCKTEGPAISPGALSFFVRTQQDGREPVVRRLGMRTDQNDMYSFVWCKSVESIEFDGRFPVARLRYNDRGLPVSVSATMFAPFVPHDSRTSGTPGFHVTFALENKSKKPVDVSLAGTLANPLAWCAPDRKLTNAVTHSADAAFLTMRTNADAPCKATLGSIGMSVSGGENTWIAGEFNGYLTGTAWFGGTALGYVRESFLRAFRLAGRLPNSDVGQSPAALLRCTDADIEAMPESVRHDLIVQLCRYPMFRDIQSRVAEVEPALLDAPDGTARYLRTVLRALNRMAGEDRTRQEWGGGALCSSITLQPGERKEIRFTLGWHFPHHFSAKGPVLGHMYEHWFADAEAVNRFLVENAAAHREAVSFADALHDTTLPPEFADAWAGQLTTLTKCTWWTKAGDFAVWEGLGCCGFHTTDITYQGSFNILALFPDLQKQQMEMGARFQRDDGRVHHFFVPDLSSVDNGFDRVDMNQQFVLLVCRDYLWTGDREYLQRLWPHIVKAMDNTAALDTDGDGLPDHDTRRNTYDAWDFRGTPSYIASLWLSALLAAARIADDLGESARAAQWRDTLKTAAAAFDRKLWNGEYYSLWADGGDRDECCMSDQLDGEWFTEVAGLGHCLPVERIRAALRAVFKHNFTADGGLINANYPPGAHRMLSTFRNLQAEAPWTGIEYAMASMMLEFGLDKEASAVIKNVHGRYLRAGRFWDHVECGNHYYRAMSSWAVLLSAAGFKVDAPAQTVTFAPPAPTAKFRAPCVSSTGWGTFEQKRGRFELRCLSGTLSFKTLRLNAVGLSAASLDGKPRAASVTQADNGLTLVRFNRPVTLAVGSVLTLRK